MNINSHCFHRFYHSIVQWPVEAYTPYTPYTIYRGQGLRGSRRAPLLSQKLRGKKGGKEDKKPKKKPEGICAKPGPQFIIQSILLLLFNFCFLKVLSLTLKKIFFSSLNVQLPGVLFMEQLVAPLLGKIWATLGRSRKISTEE